MKTRLVWLATFSAGIAILVISSCTSTIPNRDPVGEPFPRVEGMSLRDEPVVLPDAFAGRRTLLLIGYLQEAQFDIDRWAYGLMQAQLRVTIREVPAVRGLVPRLIGNQIDAGMRRGIPEEDWSSVVTVYGDAGEIAALTGTENGRNARVLLLDEGGRILWFHDRGFSPRLLLELEQLVTSNP